MVSFNSRILICSLLKKLKEFLNPCKSDEESQLEEVHLNITKLINNDPENPYLATNSALIINGLRAYKKFLVGKLLLELF